MNPEAMPSPDFTPSRQLWEKACGLIPCGTNTNAKRVTSFLDPDTFPAYATRAAGPYVFDLEDRRYIDYIAALGPILLGYGDARVKARIASQLDRGWLFSLPDPAEVELAEVLTRILPCCERVRLFKTGAEATSAAVRCARLATGREVVIQCGYHGWHDWWAVTLHPRGIPAATAGATVAFRYNDLDSFADAIRRHGEKAACIVVAPAGFGVEPAPGFLEAIRSEAHRLGIVLVFDEVVTGFRWALGGAMEKYGVVPDLACIGKSMANGMPISALVGRADLMEGFKDTWISSTFAGESLSIVAALETIAILRDGGIHGRLYALARDLNRGIAGAARAAGAGITIGAAVPGLRLEFEGSPEQKDQRARRFVGVCAAHGVLVRREGLAITLCLIAALSDADVAETLRVFALAFAAA